MLQDKDMWNLPSNIGCKAFNLHIGKVCVPIDNQSTPTKARMPHVVFGNNIGSEERAPVNSSSLSGDVGFLRSSQ